MSHRRRSRRTRWRGFSRCTRWGFPPPTPTLSSPSPTPSGTPLDTKPSPWCSPASDVVWGFSPTDLISIQHPFPIRRFLFDLRLPRFSV